MTLGANHISLQSERESIHGYHTHHSSILHLGSFILLLLSIPLQDDELKQNADEILTNTFTQCFLLNIYGFME